MAVLQIEQILHKFEDQKFANFFLPRTGQFLSDTHQIGSVVRGWTDRYIHRHYKVHYILHSHKFIIIELGKTSLLEFLEKLSTMSSFGCVVLENDVRL